MVSKLCKRGCNVEIEWKGKIKGKKGSTGFFEIETGLEHTFFRCNDLIKEKGANASLT